MTVESAFCKNCKHPIMKYKSVWLHMEYVKVTKNNIKLIKPSGRVLCVKQHNTYGSCGCIKPEYR